MYVCMYVRTYVCMYVYMYASMYVCELGHVKESIMYSYAIVMCKHIQKHYYNVYFCLARTNLPMPIDMINLCWAPLLYLLCWTILLTCHLSSSVLSGSRLGTQLGQYVLHFKLSSLVCLQWLVAKGIRNLILTTPARRLSSLTGTTSSRLR